MRCLAWLINLKLSLENASLLNRLVSFKKKIIDTTLLNRDKQKLLAKEFKQGYLKLWLGI